MKNQDLIELFASAGNSRCTETTFHIKLFNTQEGYRKISYGSCASRHIYLVDRGGYVWFYSIPPQNDSYWNEAPYFFLQIPKTAGLSISLTLGKHQLQYGFGHMWGRFYPKNIHKKLRTIVRNPYDRLVSAYLFMVRGGFHKNPEYAEIRDNYQNFEDWVLNGLDEDLIRMNRGNYVGWKETFLPQCYWLLDEEDKLIPEKENIGYFENLSEEVKRLFDIKDLPHLNRSEKKQDWRSFYGNPLVRDKVNRLYQKDFQILGYKTQG